MISCQVDQTAINHTPLAMTNHSGQTVWAAYYRPFGEAVIEGGATVTNNFRFPGQYYDQETGLHYNYHRYYDPATGRYLSPDPIGAQKGKIHLYVYTGNNPISYIDSLGLQTTTATTVIPPCPPKLDQACYNLCIEKMTSPAGPPSDACLICNWQIGTTGQGYQQLGPPLSPECRECQKQITTDWGIKNGCYEGCLRQGTRDQCGNCQY